MTQWIAEYIGMSIVQGAGRGTMQKIFKMNLKIVLVIFVGLDLFCIAMGMGVPIFSILFGFPIGWYIVNRISMDTKNLNIIFKRTFFYAVITSLFTLS